VELGSRQLFFAVYILVHILVLGLGFVHYQMKENLSGARKVFGYGFRE